MCGEAPMKKQRSRDLQDLKVENILQMEHLANLLTVLLFTVPLRPVAESQQHA